MRKPRSILFIILLSHAAFFTKNSYAQSEKFFQKDSGDIAGNWTGNSLCQVKNSACHDEIVEYNILKGDSDIYHVSMNKIVKGKTEFMGVVDCSYEESTKTLSFSDEGTIWQFTMNHATMNGILIWRDQLYRKIHLQKQ